MKNKKKKRIKINKKMIPNLVFFNVFLTTVTFSVIAVYIAVNSIDPMCKITFDSSGGSSVDTITFKCGEIPPKPEDPTKVGFNFLGWFNGDEECDFKYIVENDTDLIAKWETDGTYNIYTIIFDTNGGNDIEPIEIAEGEKLVEIPTPIKDGYNFIGWLLNGVPFNFDAPITENITLVAEYEIGKHECEYTIGRKVNNTQTIEKGSTIKNVLYGFTTSRLNNKCEITNKVSPKTGVTIKTNSIKFDKTGKYTITSCIVDKKTKTELECAKQTLNVTDKQDIVVNSIRFGEFTNKVASGDTFKLELISDPSEYSSLVTSKASITSSDNSIAYYSNGIFKAVKAGTVTFTAKYNSLSTSITITVENKIIPVTKVNVSPSSVTKTVGDESFRLNCVLEPSNTTENNITWESNNKTVATVENGLVTIKNTGEADIICMSGGKTGSAKIKVNPLRVNQITINGDNEIIQGRTKNYTATVSPSNATDKRITWSIVNGTGKATINQNGEVTATDAGTVKIIAKAEDGSNKSAEKEITILSTNATGVSLNKTGTVEVYAQETVNLQATVYPDYATNKNVSWSSSNPTDIKISSTSGQSITVTAYKGEGVISCTTEDGNHVATVNIKTIYRPMVVNASLTRENTGVRIRFSISGGTEAFTINTLEFYQQGNRKRNTNEMFNLIGYPKSNHIYETYIDGFINGPFSLKYKVTDTAGHVKESEVSID